MEGKFSIKLSSRLRPAPVKQHYCRVSSPAPFVSFSHVVFEKIFTAWPRIYLSPQVREYGKFLPVEFGILGLGFRNTAVRIRNPSSTEKDLESAIHGVESRIQHCIGFLYTGRCLVKRITTKRGKTDFVSSSIYLSSSILRGLTN